MRILDAGFVHDVVWADQRIAFDYVQRIAMVISRPVEPSPRNEPGGVDDERVTLPVAVRPSHPIVRGSILGSLLFIFLHVDRSQGVRELIYDHDVVCALNNLERKRHVVGARDARPITLKLRVAGRVPLLIGRDVYDHSIVGVRFLHRQRLRLVRDFAALHNSLASRPGSVCTHDLRMRSGLGVMA